MDDDPPPRETRVTAQPFEMPVLDMLLLGRNARHCCDAIISRDTTCPVTHTSNANHTHSSTLPEEAATSNRQPGRTTARDRMEMQATSSAKQAKASAANRRRLRSARRLYDAEIDPRAA